ncbi:MAG: HAD family hydrolase [Chloroflexota bacterium]
MRILALDMDDTLLQSDGTISNRTLKALDQWQTQGNRIVIATGRPHRSIAPSLPEPLLPLPRICYNGAEIRHNDERIYADFIPDEQVGEVTTFIQTQYPGINVGVEVEDDHYCLYPRGGRLRISYQVVERLDNLGKPAAKILMWPENETDLQPLIDWLPPTVGTFITPKFQLVQIQSGTADKSTALKALVEGWGYSLADVVAMGDDVNDTEMLRVSGFGVAVENALPEVKAAANRVTVSNDEDAVAVIVEELLGIQ